MTSEPNYIISGVQIFYLIIIKNSNNFKKNISCFIIKINQSLNYLSYWSFSFANINEI
jgi:hypothetical protein